MTRRRRLLQTVLQSQARKGVRIRIAYDNATNPGADVIPTDAPSQIESDQRPIGAESFVRSFADVAQVKGITGYRALMHNKYILRDVDSADAATFSPVHQRIIRTTRGGFRITTFCVCVRNNWPHITQKTSPTFGRAGRSSTRLAIATPAPSA